MVYYSNLAMFQPIYINCSRMAIVPFGIVAKYYISQVEKKIQVEMHNNFTGDTPSNNSRCHIARPMPQNVALQYQINASSPNV